jgi:hypothetical protein
MLVFGISFFELILISCLLQKKTCHKKRLNYALARMTLWPETLWPGHFGQNDTLARVTLWTETLWPETVWPVFPASFGVPKGE